MLSPRSLMLVLLFSAVGGVVGGMVAVGIIGIDPHPFRSLPAVATDRPAQDPTIIQYDLRGQRISPR